MPTRSNSAGRGRRRHRLDVHGADGTLVLEATGSPHSSAPAHVLGAQHGAKELTEIEVPQDDWVAAAGLKGGLINIGRLWKSFAESFADGDGTFAPSFESAVEHHKLIDAVRIASETGETQKLQGRPARSFGAGLDTRRLASRLPAGGRSG